MSKVFLVEQDARLREWCRLHLETQGFVVTAFDHGRRALEALRGEAPDLVMIGTDLDGMSAFACAAAMRSNIRSGFTPLLFLVPGTDTAALAQALAIEPDGVLTKPFTSEALMQAVGARLGTLRAASATASPPGRVASGPSGAVATGAESGLLLETKQASVLVVNVRNFVSLARVLNASGLDRLLGQFAAHARQAIFGSGGWIVRADAMSVLALFEDVPSQGSPHAARALEAALGVVLAARRTKRWSEAVSPNHASLDISIGCGVHSGEVIVARLTVGSHLAPCIAGQTADLAHRLDGRAKGLHWSVACSEATLLRAGERYEVGQRSSLTDTDHGVTIPIVEIVGFMPGMAMPGELPKMGEVREAVVANTLLASLPGDVDEEAADRTIMVRGARTSVESFPTIPDRRVERRLKQSSQAEAYLATHLASERQELVKVIQLAKVPAAFVERYLTEYRRLLDIEQRNIASAYEVGQTKDVVFVALEYIPGESLATALRRHVAIGTALNATAQACLALDTLHQAGIVHGSLRLEHFLFRGDGALVLVDFNVTARVSAMLRLPGLSAASASSSSSLLGAKPRTDFLALGKILHALATGETTLLSSELAGAGEAQLRLASRLPLPLSPLQPCLDGLLGVGNQAPWDQAQDVLVALLSLRDIFPFDMRAGSLGAGTLRRRTG